MLGGLFDVGGIADELRVRLDLTLNAVVAGAIVGFAGAAAFICGLVVLFLWVMQTYGTLQAWAAITAAFGVVALLALIPLASSSRKRRAITRAAEQRVAVAEAERTAKKNRDPDWWQDPATLLTGLQIVRMLGIKRMLPILAVAAVAAGFLISRSGSGEEDENAEIQPAE